MAMSMADIQQQLAAIPAADTPMAQEPRPTDQVSTSNTAAIPAGGIGDIKSATEILRNLGRGADDILAHVSPNELVVPTEVLDRNPEIKDLIYAELRTLGYENPERFLAGSEANSINPETGLPEFFSLKDLNPVRAVRSIARGVGDVLSSVGDVLSDVAPKVLPFVLAATPLGPVYGAALGSGIGTLLQGGDLKDAFKSALISGAIGGVASGAAEAVGGGSFSEGFTGAFESPSARLSQTLSGLKEGTPFESFAKPSYSEVGAKVNPAAEVRSVAPVSETSVTQAAKASAIPQTGTVDASIQEALKKGVTQTPPQQVTLLDTIQQKAGQAYDAAGNLYNEYLSPSRGIPSPEEIFSSESFKSATASGLSPDKAYDLAAGKMTPGVISQYAPLAALGTAGLALAGGFETPQPEPYDYFEGKTRYFDMTPQERAQYLVGTRRNYRDYSNPVVASPYQLRYAKDGGIMSVNNFPRRNGAISGPGTETSDDIPAMLSDGEFVLTARAVRGAGNGDRNRGVSNLYEMMRTFERMA